MKLSNFFVGNTFTISQSGHGSLQGNKALDCVPTSGTRVLAPCDMDIYYRKNDLGHQSYSYGRGDGFKIIFVHCILEKSGNVKRGQDIGYLASGGAVHLHTAIEVNGVWDFVLNYMDRTINLALTSGFSSQHWKNWSTWKDLNLGTNNMAQWCLPQGDYDYGLPSVTQFFNTYADANAIKTMPAMIWFVKHGATRFNQLLDEKNNRITQLEQVNKTNADTIVKINASIGGLTTDRDKYKGLVTEKENIIKVKDDELNTLKIGLEGVQNELKECNLSKDTCENNLENQIPFLENLLKENEVLRGEKITNAKEIENLRILLDRCKKDAHGNPEDYKNLARAFVRWLRKIFYREKE